MDDGTPTSDTETLDGRITLRHSTRDRKPTMYLDPTFKVQLYNEKTLLQDIDVYNISLSQYSINKGIRKFGESGLKSVKKN